MSERYPEISHTVDVAYIQRPGESWTGTHLSFATAGPRLVTAMEV